jgi:DNA-binding MarR family transcriptional regulator
VVRGLTEAGLVSSTADPGDARRQVIRLTRRGRHLIRRAHEARLTYLGELAAGISAAELATAASVLDRLRLAARRADADTG